MAIQSAACAVDSHRAISLPSCEKLIQGPVLSGPRKRSAGFEKVTRCKNLPLGTSHTQLVVAIHHKLCLNRC